jgi:hypothetical protein
VADAGAEWLQAAHVGNPLATVLAEPNEIVPG